MCAQREKKRGKYNVETQPGKYDCIKLENQLCFPLYACAKEIIRKYKPFLDEINLTYTQYIAMMVMWEHKEMNVKTLGEYLYLDSATLTPMLKSLEKKGYISRSRSEKDGRNLRVVITDAGEALKEKAVEIPARLGACVSLDISDAQELYRILHTLMKSF